MKLNSVTIIQKTQVLTGAYLLRLQASDIASETRPGQFVMVNCGPGCVLPRPISVHGITDSGELDLLVNVIGKGTDWIVKHRAGETLDLIGPLGNGFTVAPRAARLLLIAGGIGIAPLAFLAQKSIALGKSVTLLMGAATANKLYPIKLLPKNLAVIQTTEDGSSGQKGMVADILSDYLDAADQIFACGPIAMYRTMARKVMSNLRTKSIQVSLEVRMGCGIGACYSCSIKTVQGMKKVCKDGPVFELADIVLDEVRL